MPELKIKKPNRIAVWMNDFKGKSRADKRRECHARQADVQHDRAPLSRIGRYRRLHAEKLTKALPNGIPQNAEKRSRRNGKPPQQERSKKQQHKRRRKHPEPPGIDRCFIRRNDDLPTAFILQ